MATPSSVFTEMVTTTKRNLASSLADNVSNHNALFRQMKRKGKFKTENGGYEIMCPLEYAENGTYQRYTGYEPLNTEASDVLTSAKFDWRQAAIHVTASGDEIRKNAHSREGMKKLVQARKDVAMKTAANQMSIDIYSDGSLDNQINGLANLIQTNGQGTVGGINSATFDFWQNQYHEMTGTDAYDKDTIRKGMSQLWLLTTRGTDTPDTITMSHDFYTVFEAGIEDRARYTEKDSANEGFISLKYKNADVFFDDNTNFGTTAEKAYFLNTDYLYLVQHRDASWTMDDEKRPVNMDAVVIPIYWMGNMMCSNRALQGVLIDAA